MTKRDYKDYILDLSKAANMAVKIVQDMSFEQYEDSIVTQLAVERCFQIMGEAVKNIPETIKSQHHFVEWHKITAMRNRIVHEYFGIDQKIVYQTVIDDLTPLLDAIDKLYKQTISLENNV